MSLFALQAQAHGYKGPVLGPRESVPQPRTWSTEQLTAGKHMLSFVACGSSKGANQSGMNFGRQRGIIDAGFVTCNGVEGEEEEEKEEEAISNGN